MRFSPFGWCKKRQSGQTGKKACRYLKLEFGRFGIIGIILLPHPFASGKIMGMSVRQNREPTGCRRLFAPGQNPRGRCKLSYGALMQIDLPAVGEPLGSDREGVTPGKKLFFAKRTQ